MGKRLVARGGEVVPPGPVVYLCPVAPSPHSPAFPARPRPARRRRRRGDPGRTPSARLQPRGEASGCGLSPFSLEGPPRRERAFPDIRILGILWNYRARGSARKPRRDKGFARLPATVAGRRANGFGQTRQPFAADVATDLGRRCGAPLQRAPWSRRCIAKTRWKPRVGFDMHIRSAAIRCNRLPARSAAIRCAPPLQLSAQIRCRSAPYGPAHGFSPSVSPATSAQIRCNPRIPLYGLPQSVAPRVMPSARNVCLNPLQQLHADAVRPQNRPAVYTPRGQAVVSTPFNRNVSGSPSRRVTRAPPASTSTRSRRPR